MRFDYDKVQREMVRMNLSQRMLAKRAKVAPSNISQLMKMIREGNEIETRRAGKLCRALKVTIEDIEAA